MDYMARALDLARRAQGWCSPNPAVGAVLVQNGQIVGEGFTQQPGSSHAEIIALQAAGPAARGADLYVTLEPCCHYGRTPPCTDALIATGLREVHAALLDPSPWVNGGGIRALEAAGIPVMVGERAAEARRLNEAYFKWVRDRVPFLTLKYAMTADGKIATHTGSSFWITGLEARRYVARLRSTVEPFSSASARCSRMTPSSPPGPVIWAMPVRTRSTSRCGWFSTARRGCRRARKLLPAGSPVKRSC